MADGPKRGTAVNKQKLCEILGWNREAFDRQVRDGMPVAERPSGRGGDYVPYTGDVIRWLVERALEAAGHRSAERRRKRLGVMPVGSLGLPAPTPVGAISFANSDVFRHASPVG